MTFDLRHDVGPGEHIEEAIPVIREEQRALLLPEVGEEVHSALGARNAVEHRRHADFSVAARLRHHGIEAEVVARERPEAGVDDLLLLHALHGAALPHLLVDVRDADDDEALVVLHEGDRHADVAGPVVAHQTVGHDEGAVLRECVEQRLALHRLRELLAVLGVHVLVDLYLRLLEEVPATARLGQRVVLVVGLVLDELFRVQVHVVQVLVAARERLRDVGVDDAGPARLLVGFLGRGNLALDAHHVRHVLADAEHALAPCGVGVLELGRLELVYLAASIRKVLDEDVRGVHRQGDLVLLCEFGRRRLVEDLIRRVANDAVRALLMRVLREVLVAGQVHAGLSVLGEVHARHVVQQRGDGLVQLRDALRLLEQALLLAGRALRLQLLQEQDDDDREDHRERAHHDGPVLLDEAREGHLLIGVHV